MRNCLKQNSATLLKTNKMEEEKAKEKEKEKEEPTVQDNGWNFDDYKKSGKLEELKVNNPSKYKELVKQKFRISDKKQKKEE